MVVLSNLISTPAVLTAMTTSPLVTGQSVECPADKTIKNFVCWCIFVKCGDVAKDSISAAGDND